MDDPVSQLPDIVRDLCSAATPDVQRDTLERYFAPDAGFTHPLCAVPRFPGSRAHVLAIYQYVSMHILQYVRRSGRIMGLVFLQVVSQSVAAAADQGGGDQCVLPFLRTGYSSDTPMRSLRRREAHRLPRRRPDLPPLLLASLARASKVRTPSSPLASLPLILIRTHHPSSRLLVKLQLAPSPSNPAQLLIANQTDFYQPAGLLALLVPPLVPPLTFGLQLTARVCSLQTHLFQHFGLWRPSAGAGANGSARVDDVSAEAAAAGMDRSQVASADPVHGGYMPREGED